MHIQISNTLFDRLAEAQLKSDPRMENLPFPKEFKRTLLGRYDPRFMGILLATFVLLVSLTWLMATHLVRQSSELDYSSLQQRYAHLLLDHSGEAEFFNKISKKQDTYLYDVVETKETSFYSIETSSQAIGRSGGLNGTRGRSNREGSGINTSGVINGSAQRGNGSANQTGSGGAAQRIAGIGILSYISDDPHGSSGEVRDVLAYHGGGNGSLEDALALANYGHVGAGGGQGALSAIAGPGHIKGAKVVISDQEIFGSLTPLDKASFKTVTKNTELEATQQSLLAQKANKAAARKPEHVTRVVMQHNRAIQDCYKQALRQQPDLKGKVVVRFFVSPDGKVEQVELISSTIDYEPMIQCILNRIRRWNDFGECDLSLGTVGYRQTYVFGY